MSISSVFFTNKGRILQSKCMLGKPLNFTKIIIGDGELNGKVIQELETLLSPKLEIPITRLVTVDTAKVKIGGKFNNSNLANGFYYRELGLFAIDPDSNIEMLYCYGNAANLAEYISSQGSEIIEKQIEIIAVVGNEANVTATINDSLLSVSPEDLEAHNNDENAHKPIRTWITNLIANLTLPWSKITEKPSAYPPSAHTHSKSQINDFPVSLPASDVYSWAKQPTKPNYNALEVGAIPSTATCNKNWNWNGQSGQPSWVWGGENGTDMHVYNPANFSVYNSARLGGYTLDEIKSKFGGDIVGKKMNYESVSVSGAKNVLTLLKSFSYARGGMVRIPGHRTGTYPYLFTIKVDGVFICQDVFLTNLFGFDYGTSTGSTHFLDIPFDETLEIYGRDDTATDTSGSNSSYRVNFIYYLNK